MEIHLTNNKAHEEKVRAALKKNEGYCPCAIEKTPETKCICKEFREQTAPGACHSPFCPVPASQNTGGF